MAGFKLPGPEPAQILEGHEGAVLALHSGCNERGLAELKEHTYFALAILIWGRCAGKCARQQPSNVLYTKNMCFC